MIARARRLAIVCACAFAPLAWTAQASAQAPRPWRLDFNPAPTNLQPGSEAVVVASASNSGDIPIDGEGAHRVVLTDQLPAGLEVPAGVAASAIRGMVQPSYEPPPAYGTTLECTIEEAHRKEVTCTTTSRSRPIPSYSELRVQIPVKVADTALSGEQNRIAVSGGEEAISGETLQAPAETLESAITVSSAKTPFGIERYEFTPEYESGAVDHQAGSHPFQLSTTLDLNETLTPYPGKGELPSAPEMMKGVNLELPPGLLGDAGAIKQCTDVQFSTLVGSDAENQCPADTAVGVALVTLTEPNSLGTFAVSLPVFNLEPEGGEPARFGFEAEEVRVIIDTSVRTGGSTSTPSSADYGVTVGISNTTQAAQLLSSRVTLWGEPYQPSHDASRGWSCLREKEVGGVPCAPLEGQDSPSAAFLSLPTACTGALASEAQADGWTNPGDFQTGESIASSLTSLFGEGGAGVEGCASVPFKPSISAQPVEDHERRAHVAEQRETVEAEEASERAEEQAGSAPRDAVSSASTPTGLNVDVRLPVEAGGLSESAVRGATVTLPAGVQLNPSAANGLQACSEEQVGYEGRGSDADPLAPGVEEPLRFSPAKASCPKASVIGTVVIRSPDLSYPLEGSVYLAAQEANPFGSLFAVYLVAEDRAQPSTGLRVKLAGKVEATASGPDAGQLTTTFEQTPQAPFEELRLHFLEGPRASLSTPPTCGSYAAGASFTGWNGASEETSSQPAFDIDSGAEGTPCTNPLAFSPSFAAGSTSVQAGAFTSFTLTIGHPDADQPLAGLVVHLPPGIAALLSSVTPCQPPSAGQEWACGPESLIGHSTASSGVGSEPYTLPGDVYLTSGYDNAPFGLLVATPAKAGPFDLGMVYVRSRIEVNPNTAAVTIVSEPFPQFVRGVPVQLKQITVTVDRAGFEFNPTNCNRTAIEGTITGAAGGSESVSSPFQVANCASLPFAPTLTATTAGHASKLDGASLLVKVTSAGLGQANIAKVDLQLPEALPSQLTTLQKACPEAVFDANPASCDEGSVIGHAIIHTPVLRSALAGPAYLVSHGGAAFPDVEFVLQGEGITLVLDGKTDIKNGITYSRFESAPDAPFTTFETDLPAGPHAVLTAHVSGSEPYNLCKASLVMPTYITAQNGYTIAQNTHIAVTGCAGVLGAKTTLTKAQLLAKALKACGKDRKKRKRVACERAARKRYGTHKAKAKRSSVRHG